MSKIFRYKSETPLSFSKSVFEPDTTEDYVEVELHDGKAVIYDSYRAIGDKSVRDGLIFDIFLDEWEESEARGWKNLFASILSFSSKSEVKRPKLVQKIESEEEVADFQQIYRLDNSIPPESNVVDVEFFKELNDALTAMYEEDRAAFRELGRAFMYYRKSLGEMKMEDRFTDLYIVLDALMMKLRDYYISKEGLDGSQDKKFGLRELFDGFSENDFDEDVYEARCELFHEGKKQKAIEMVEDVEEAVERGICLLLDINFEQYEQILSQKPIRVGKDPALLLQANLEGYEVPEGGISLDLPHFDIEDTNLEVVPVTTEEGKGIGIDTELGDFLEYDSNGISDLNSWFGTRGTVEPNEDPDNLF